MNEALGATLRSILFCLLLTNGTVAIIVGYGHVRARCQFLTRGQCWLMSVGYAGWSSYALGGAWGVYNRIDTEFQPHLPLLLFGAVVGTVHLFVQASRNNRPMSRSRESETEESRPPLGIRP